MIVAEKKRRSDVLQQIGKTYRQEIFAFSSTLY